MGFDRSELEIAYCRKQDIFKILHEKCVSILISIQPTFSWLILAYTRNITWRAILKTVFTHNLLKVAIESGVAGASLSTVEINTQRQVQENGFTDSQTLNTCYKCAEIWYTSYDSINAVLGVIRINSLWFSSILT